MNEIKLINRHHKPEPNPRMIYIGRGSPLGNPFVINDRWDRNFVIDQYAKWLQWKLDSKDTVVVAELTRIAQKVLDGTGEPVLLECFCSPARCHGEVIQQVIHEAIQRKLHTT